MLITNFASGELSPTLNGRIDIPQYYQGCSRLQNFDIIPTGGIERRVGTKRMLELDGNYRLIPFILDKNNNFIFLLKRDKLLIYQYMSNGSLTKVQEYNELHFTDNEISEMQYAQNYDTMVFVHRNHKPIILKYNLLETFSISEMQFDYYPDVNLDDDYDFIMLPNNSLPNAVATMDGHLEFTYNAYGSSTPTVKKYEVDVKKVYCIYNGKLWEYAAATGWRESGMNGQIDDSLFSAETKYPGCVAFWNNRLYFAASEANRQRVWASAAPDTRETRYNDFNMFQKFVTVNKVVKDADLHVFTCDLHLEEIDTTNNTFTLRNVSQNFAQSGALSKDIKNYFVTGNFIPVGTKVISCTETSITINTANIGIQSDKNNETVSIQLWRTANSVSADDYEFQVISNDMVTPDCAFYFDIASSENDAIMFLCPNNTMTIGTESSVWSLGSDASASSFNVQMQGRYGSDQMQALSLGSACIYFAQGKKGIREFYYNATNEAFQTNDIAILAKHILAESAAADFDYITNPYNRLLIVRNDGEVAGLLYDKNNGVLGWYRMKHGKGKIKNTAVIRGYDQWDIMYFIAEKDGNYTLEMLDPGQKVYLDSWRVYAGSSEGYDENAAVLYNATKDVVCTLSDIPQGFSDAGDVVYIGYKYESDIISMPVVNNNEKKRIVALNTRFLNSYMPVMKCTGVADEKFIGTQVPFSGVRKINYPGASDYDVTFELKTDEPKPVNILSVDAVLA